MDLVYKIKNMLGGCPSCQKFGKETQYDEPFTRLIDGLSEPEEITPYSKVCRKCGYELEKGHLSDITTKATVDEVYGGAGWGWYDVTVYYKRGVKIGEIQGCWHPGDNR